MIYFCSIEVKTSIQFNQYYVIYWFYQPLGGEATEENPTEKESTEEVLMEPCERAPILLHLHFLSSRSTDLVPDQTRPAIEHDRAISASAIA